MSRPWMPFYVGDYLKDTTHLSPAQHGHYLLLILHYWSKGGLPDDEQQLAIIAHMTPDDWQRNRSTLQAFFHSGWKHKRLDQELKRHAEVYAKRVAASEKGVAVRAMNRYRKR